MLNPTATHTVVSTVSAGAQVMGIDDDGMSTVLSILSNMYSDGALAVVREYSCNALDSHVEAGNPDPILVTSPNFLNPTLTVQDFGVGLSHDEVLNVYARYGASTKRNSNEQIGAFGIGAKSAFTVGTQFVVTAVKDGEQTVALFAMNEAGAPTVNIISRTETDEPNGVKVEIGVRDIEAVQSAIDRLFATWQPGTVLVDGVEPASLWAQAQELTPNIHLAWREDRYNTSDPAWMIVMGGVPYKLPDAVRSSLDTRQRNIVVGVQSTLAKVILTVPIGAVDITPSREDLKVTPKTTATLNEAIEKFNQSLPAWITEQIDGAKTKVGAMIVRRKLQSQIGVFAQEHLEHATWHGQRLGVGRVEFPPSVELISLNFKRGNSYDKIAKRRKGLELVPNSEIEKYLFVMNTPDRRVRSVQLAAKPYLQAQPQDGVTYVVAVNRPRFSSEWFDTNDVAVLTVEYDEFVTKWKPTYSARNTSGVVQYPVDRSKYPDCMTAQELNDLDEPILYLTAEEEGVISQGNPFLAEVMNKHTVVFLKPTQKAEVLVKRVPVATSALPYIRAVAKKTLKSLSQNDLDTMAATEWNREVSYRLMSFLKEHRNEITNPVVLNVINTNEKALKLRDSQNANRLLLLQQAAVFLGTTLDTSKKTPISLDEYRKVQDGLPLLYIYLNNSYPHTDLGNKHAVSYINSTVL